MSSSGPLCYSLWKASCHNPAMCCRWSLPETQMCHSDEGPSVRQVLDTPWGYLVRGSNTLSFWQSNMAGWKAPIHNHFCVFSLKTPPVYDFRYNTNWRFRLDILVPTGFGAPEQHTIFEGKSSVPVGLWYLLQYWWLHFQDYSRAM